MQHLIQRNQAATFKPYIHHNRIAFDLSTAAICEQSHNDIANEPTIKIESEEREEDVKMTTTLTPTTTQILRTGKTLILSAGCQNNRLQCTEATHRVRK